MMMASALRRVSLLLLGAPVLLALPTLHARQEPSTNSSLFGRLIYSNDSYVFVSCDAQQGPALLKLFLQIGDVIRKQLLPASQNPTQDPAQDAYSVSSWMTGLI